MVHVELWTRRGVGVKSPRRLAVLAALCGTVALAGWDAARLGIFGSGIEYAATPIGDLGTTRGAASLSADAGEPVDAPLASAMTSVATVAGAHLGLPEPAVAPAAMSVGKAATAVPDPPETAA